MLKRLYAGLQGAARRRAFQADLRTTLDERGIGLGGANLGRSQTGAPAWIVTTTHPTRGIERLVFMFPLEADPYSRPTLNDLIGRVSARSRA